MGRAFLTALVSRVSPRPGRALPNLLPRPSQLERWAFATLGRLHVLKGVLGTCTQRGSAPLPSLACPGLGQAFPEASCSSAEGRRALSAPLRPPRAKPRHGRGQAWIHGHRTDVVAGERRRAPWGAGGQTPVGRAVQTGRGVQMCAAFRSD